MRTLYATLLYSRDNSYYYYYCDQQKPRCFPAFLADKMLHRTEDAAVSVDSCNRWGRALILQLGHPNPRNSATGP